MSFIPEYDRPELPGKDDPEALGLGRDFFRGIEGCDDEPAPPAPVSAEFGTLTEEFWGPFDGGERTFSLVMAEGETLFAVHCLPEALPGDDWGADPPFVFPPNWENAINAGDSFAGVRTVDFGGFSFLAVPYVYTGSEVLSELTLTVRGGDTAAFLFIFGITIGEGGTVGDWIGAGLSPADEGDPVVAVGNAEESGKRFAVTLAFYSMAA